MSKANYSKRNKLVCNLMYNPTISGSDKVILWAMHLKYIDGEQLLEYIQTQSPTAEQIQEYVEQKLRENRKKND